MRPYQKMQKPSNLPGICLRCRSGDSAREWFVDTGIDTDYEGTVYLCNACIIDLANSIPDILTRDTHLAMLSVQADQVRELHDVVELLGTWRQLFQEHFATDLDHFMTTIEDIHGRTSFSNPVSLADYPDTSGSPEESQPKPEQDIILSAVNFS